MSVNRIIIDGVIGWDITASEFKEKLKGLSGDLIIEINSAGGSVYEGIDIFNAIKNYSKGHIKIKVTSLAASMASIG